MPKRTPSHKPRVVYAPPRTLADKRASNGRALALDGAAWRKLRARVLREQPLCEYCPPLYQAVATEVDHADNDPSNNDRDNLRSTCKPCHSAKTMRELHGKAAPIGCDANGYPITQISPATDAPQPFSPLRAHRRTYEV